MFRDFCIFGILFCMRIILFFSVGGVWCFIQVICVGLLLLMKYSVWLKGIYCSGFIILFWWVNICFLLFWIFVVSLMDGLNNWLLYFFVCLILGMVGGCRLLWIICFLKVFIFWFILLDCFSVVRCCMIIVSMFGFFIGYRLFQVLRLVVVIFCFYISRVISFWYFMVLFLFVG